MARTVVKRWAPVLAAMTLAIALSSLRGAGGQSVPPTLIVSPTSGPVGTVAQANGTGFAAATCGVNLTLDTPQGPALGFVAVNAGAFATTVTIPVGTTDGGHVVVAQGLLLAGEFCTAPSGEQATADFRV